MKRTKIIATLGPATHTEDKITSLIEAGVDAVRLNFSHGTYDDHAALITLVRVAAQKLNRQIAIIQDLQGPKIRLGTLPEAGVVITDGESVIFDTSVHEYSGAVFPVDFAQLHESMKPGDRLLISDGQISTQVTAIAGTQITATVVHGGTLFSHKGINVPDSAIAVSALTTKDRADAEFGVSQGVDYIALSFVRQPSDITELRQLIAQKVSGTVAPKIIAKMERPEAVTNMVAIVAETDVIMVARGDLGIEIASAQVPVVQKQLIETARSAGKPVIVATQMLDSMQHSPQPTRAEVSDVANAVIDLTDAVMLSNETATGDFPVETVAMMASIITTTEASKFDNANPLTTSVQNLVGPDVLAALTRQASDKTEATMIITATRDGELARHISQVRPSVPIITVTDNDLVARQLALFSGVYATLGSLESEEQALQVAHEFVLGHNWAKAGEIAVVAVGKPFATAHTISILEIKAV